MKKIFSVLLVFGLGLILISGCQTASTTPATTTIPASTVASGLGTITKSSLGVDDTILGITSALSVKSSAITYSTPEYGADGWWHTSGKITVLGITREADYYFKVWDSSGNEIITLAALRNIDTSSDASKIWVFGTDTTTDSSSSVTLGFGASKSNPFKVEGLNTSSQTFNGPIIYSSSYSGTSYQTTVTYSSVTTGASGYPSGTVSFSSAAGGTETFSGSIVFNGTATATISFSNGTSYTINLDTGAVTPAAI